MKCLIFKLFLPPQQSGHCQLHTSSCSAPCQIFCPSIRHRILGSGGWRGELTQLPPQSLHKNQVQWHQKPSGKKIPKNIHKLIFYTLKKILLKNIPVWRQAPHLYHNDSESDHPGGPQNFLMGCWAISSISHSNVDDLRQKVPSELGKYWGLVTSNSFLPDDLWQLEKKRNKSGWFPWLYYETNLPW